MISVLFFCMPGVGHFHALRGVIAAIAQRGLTAHVLTDASYRRAVERHGGQFHDLFAGRPLAEADDTSKPVPCRYVSFAAHFADSVIAEARRLNPGLIVYDTQAVIGPVVAHALDLPCVCSTAGHDVNPARFVAALQTDSRVAVSEKCWRAAEKLRSAYGLTDASPFSYVTALSPTLNLYGEPPQFLAEENRAAFEPLAFFGCLPALPPENPGPPLYFAGCPPTALRVYVSFGTVVWWYFERAALALVQAIATACADEESLRVVVSLGGADIAADRVAQLENERVRVLRQVDQERLLAEADLFVTHHGINSTHEAIVRRVPMLSCPFFSDQPSLARKCQELGLALPLTTAAREAVSVQDVKRTFEHLETRRESLQNNLATARGWEVELLAQRSVVTDRLLALMSRR